MQVIQGDHIGPLLFLLCVNDIPEITQNSLRLMYSDDLKIFCDVYSSMDFYKLAAWPGLVRFIYKISSSLKAERDDRFRVSSLERQNLEKVIRIFMIHDYCSIRIYVWTIILTKLYQRLKPCLVWAWCYGQILRTTTLWRVIYCIESLQKMFVFYALRYFNWRRKTFVLSPYEDCSPLNNLEIFTTKTNNGRHVFLVCDFWNELQFIW